MVHTKFKMYLLELLIAYHAQNSARHVTTLAVTVPHADWDIILLTTIVSNAKILQDSEPMIYLSARTDAVTEYFLAKTNTYLRILCNAMTEILKTLMGATSTA